MLKFAFLSKIIRVLLDINTKALYICIIRKQQNTQTMTNFEKTYNLIKNVFAIRVAQLTSPAQMETAIAKTIADLPFLPESIVTATINQIGAEYSK